MIRNAHVLLNARDLDINLLHIPVLSLRNWLYINKEQVGVEISDEQSLENCKIFGPKIVLAEFECLVEF